MKRLITTCLLTIMTLQLWSQSGITWVSANNISTSQYGNMHPRISHDRQGNPLVVWGRMSDEAVMFTKWNGSQFITPVKLNPSWMTVATASWMGPDIASFGDTVYVVVKRTPEASDTNRIFLFSSFDAGNTFNAPVELAFIADSISRFPTVTTDLYGNPVVGFMKFNSSFMDSRWVVSRSLDLGSTFQTDVKASGWGASTEVCDCCPGAMAGNGENYAMIYRNNNSNIRDTWAGISTDSATTFTTGLAVDNNNWQLMSCPSSGPDGIISGDTLYTVFMSSGSGSARTYLSKSSISNVNLVNVENLSGNIPGLSQQNYPRIASDGTSAAIVWKQIVNGTVQLPIKFTADIQTGFNNADDTVDVANITNADVTMHNGNVWVVWEDDNSGTVKYRNGNYQSIGTNVNELDKSPVPIFPNPVGNSIHFYNLEVADAIYIYNSSGKLMGNYHLKEDNTVDVEDLTPGIYLIRIDSADRINTYKFIKQ